MLSFLSRFVSATFSAVTNTVASLENFDKEKMDSDSTDEETAIPSVFIDSSVLSPPKDINRNKNRQPYLVGNDIFFADDSMDTKYVHFEVHASKVTDENFDKSNGDMEDYSDEEGETEEYLKISIQKAPYGIIINSNVFLTNHQWHTIMSDNINMMHCLACNMYSDIRMSTGHMQSEEHLSKLALYKPLAKFDLSIIRKIRNQYHCGVCNEVYEINDNHEESNSHENNLLFAINKVSDIMYDLDIHTKQNNDKVNRNNNSYHFNANILNNRNLDNSSVNFNANIINNRNFDDSSVNESVEDDDEIYEYYTDNENENYEYVDPNSSTSYANTLKKANAIVLPKYLDKDLGNRKVKVKFDSWHMIICPKENEFYCMVCKVYIKSKGKHCDEKSHLDGLDKCKIVDTYKDYFIRQVDDKFYHCGHCNNLQWVHLLDSHINNKHQKQKRSVSESSSLSNNDNCKNKETIMETKLNTSANSNDTLINNNNDKTFNPNNNVSESTVSDSKNTVNDNLPNLTTTNNSVSVNQIMSENMVLKIFGLNITVAVLGHNVVNAVRPLRPTEFYCGLCNVAFREHTILKHIYALPHIQCLQRTPFIIPFNCNLIRAIRDFLHCAICNTAVAAGYIYIHIQEPMHTMLLNKALEINRISLPFNNVPTNNGNNVLNPKPVIKSNDTSQENKNDDKTELMKVKSPKTQKMMKNNTESSKTEIMTNGPSETELMKVKKPEKQKTNKRNTERRKTESQSELMNVKSLEKQNTKMNTEISITDLMTNDMSETELTMDDSLDSIYDFESYIYVKILNVYFRISITSYHTLVHIGDGSRYCFVCAKKVNEADLSKHIDNRTHMENLELCKFLDKPDALLRQMHLTYHCSSCNVLVSRKHLTLHNEWPTHIQELKNTCTSRKIRKIDFQQGVPHVKLDVQKEQLYLNDKEPGVNIIFKVKICENEIKKQMKIVIVAGDVLKLAWDNWNGMCSLKNGLKCIICGTYVTDDGHVLEEEHERNLQMEIKRKYLPDLFREVNNIILHCLICNLEVGNNAYTINQHITGKKHKKSVENLHLFSSHTGQYNDCFEEVLQL